MHSFTRRFNLFLGRLFLVTGILLIPSVFDAVFSVSPLLDRESYILTILAGVSVGMGLVIILFRSRIKGIKPQSKL